MTPAPRAHYERLYRMAPWYEGRTFYRCPCQAREESLTAALTLKCWSCGGIMTQWTPPGVMRDIDKRARVA